MRAPECVLFLVEQSHMLASVTSVDEQVREGGLPLDPGAHCLYLNLGSAYCMNKPGVLPDLHLPLFPPLY